jgi:hypothetical protein
MKKIVYKVLLSAKIYSKLEVGKIISYNWFLKRQDNMCVRVNFIKESIIMDRE